MDSRQPHGRQLKRTPGRQPILAKKESNVVEIRIDRVPKKTDWKEVGGGDRDKWKATFRAGTKGPSYQSRKYRG